MTPRLESIAESDRLWNPRLWLLVYLAVGIAATLAKLAPGNFVHLGVSYRPLQNFTLFRNAFFHLLQGKDIYAHFPAEQWDLYKYSPAFALAMGPLAILPYSLGAIGWNLLNLVALFAAVMSVPTDPLDAAAGRRRQAMALAFLLLPALSNLQNAQSNTLVAALMVLGWTASQAGRPARSGIWIALGIFIKPFAILALLPCLGQRRWRPLLTGLGLGSLFLAAVPVLVTGPRQLAFLYGSWLRLLQNDRATHLGMSVTGLLIEGLHLPLARAAILGAGGVALLVAPALRWRQAGAIEFQRLLLGSVLLWVVMFNYMTESPSFVIAVTGMVVWYFFQRPTRLNFGLMVFAFVGTCLSSTSLVPGELRHWLLPNYSKLLPCIAIWVAVQRDLLGSGKRRAPTSGRREGRPRALAG